MDQRDDEAAVALEIGIEEMMDAVADCDHTIVTLEPQEAEHDSIFEDMARRSGAELRSLMRQSFVTGVAPPCCMQRDLHGRYAVSGGPVRVLHVASSSV